jgi:transposase InsO family protein
MIRRRYTPTFKAQVVRDLLKEDKTLAQLAAEHGVHPTQMIKWRATPGIWNSDQGSHFTSPQYRALLLGAGVRISMDGKGRALDNVFVERLWRSAKYEGVYPNAYATRETPGSGSRAI